MFMLQTLLTCGALAWLLHRVFLVLNKPLSELIPLLGLEVPLAPDLSLSGIRCDSVTLNWTRPMGQAADVRYHIQINGVKVGEASKAETVITVAGLRPNNFYSVRVVASNRNNFHSDSRAIGFKTPLWRGEIMQKTVSVIGGYAPARYAAGLGKKDDLTVSRSDSTQMPESGLSNLSATEMSRDYSGASARSRTLVNGQLLSIGGLSTDRPALGVTNGEFPVLGNDDAQSVRQLADDLEALQREADDVQKFVAKEEADFETIKTSLIRERDSLKQNLKHKDDASTDLRKEVAQLDRQNRSAQSRKAAKEKALQQKLDERAKMRRDLTKWEEEIHDMDDQMSQWGDEKINLARDAEQQAEEVIAGSVELQRSVKALEGEVRGKVVQVKELEEARKQIEGDVQLGEGKLANSGESLEDSKWEVKLRELQSAYTKAMQSLQQAQENHRQAQERLGRWSTLGITHGSDVARLSAAEIELANQGKRSKQRRGRQRKSRTNTLSSSTNGLQVNDPMMLALTAASPNIAHATVVSPFFNMSNGMAVPTGSDAAPFGPIGFPESEHLTGGAPMSPTADALLPANLLGDEDASDVRAVRSTGGNAQIGPAFGGSAFSSIGPPGFESFSHEINSPASSGSQSASVFSSPRGSLNNLSTYPSAPESLIDSDRRSLNSIGAIGSPHDGGSTSSRRFASLFSLNLNRQRGKTLDNESPTLGTLKAGQSQSFPVNLGEALDPIGTKRRRGIHSTSWASPMTSFPFLTRNVGAGPEVENEVEVSAPVKGPTVRRKPFTMFSHRYDPLEPSKMMLGEPTSPRPTSIASSEHGFPRPSTDSQPFGWGPAVEGGIPHRGSPLSIADWSVRTESGHGNPWASHNPSRRNSIKHGSTSSLSIGMSSFDLPPAYPDSDFHAIFAFQPHKLTPPAPIGTRPASAASKELLPRLNPAAPTFKTIFSRSDAKKAERAERAVEREKERDLEWLREGTPSPPARSSRDTHSIETTSESIGDVSTESLEHSLSGTASESATPSATGTKQSIFQKITRKSSSSKFNITGWGKDKSGLFSSSAKGKGPASDSAQTQAEIDEDGDDAPLTGTRSLETTLSSPRLGSGPASGTAGSIGRSSISWSTLRSRKARKTASGADKASSISEASVSERASEAGDEEDRDEDD